MRLRECRFHRSCSLGGVHRYIQPTRPNHLPEIEKIGSGIKRKSAGILCIPTPWGLCRSGLYAPHEEQRKQQQQLFLGEFPAQLLERRIHVVFDRTGRNAQLLADLAVRKVFDVAQTEHFAAFGRQRLDGRIEAGAQVVVVEFLHDGAVVGCIVRTAQRGNALPVVAPYSPARLFLSR